MNQNRNNKGSSSRSGSSRRFGGDSRNSGRSSGSFGNSGGSSRGFGRGGNRSSFGRGGNRSSFGRDRNSNFRRNNFSSENREMHKAICSKCGKECEVPFKPTEGKPVYCKECYLKQKRF